MRGKARVRALTEVEGVGAGKDFKLYPGGATRKFRGMLKLSAKQLLAAAR